MDGSFPDKPAAFVACEYPIICDTFGMNVTTSNQFTTRSNLAIGKCGETRNEGTRPRAHWHSPISRDESNNKTKNRSILHQCFFCLPTPSHFCTVRAVAQAHASPSDVANCSRRIDIHVKKYIVHQGQYSPLNVGPSSVAKSPVHFSMWYSHCWE